MLKFSWPKNIDWEKVEAIVQIVTALVAVFSAWYAVHFSQKTARIVHFRYEAQLMQDDLDTITRNANFMRSAIDVSKFRSGKFDDPIAVQSAKNTLLLNLDPETDTESEFITFLNSFEVAKQTSVARVDTDEFLDLTQAVVESRQATLKDIRKKAR